MSGPLRVRDLEIDLKSDEVRLASRDQLLAEDWEIADARLADLGTTHPSAGRRNPRAAAARRLS